MFERVQYKKRARQHLKGHQKVAMQVSILLFFISMIVQLINLPELSHQVASTDSGNFKMTLFSANFSLTSANDSVGFFSSLLFFVLYSILMMATVHFFLAFSKNNKITFSAFLEGLSLWLKGVRAYAWQMLWIGLWSLLFFIPGIVKAVAYSQTVLILADNPKVGVRRAMRMSLEMTKGHKGSLFFMSLSFLGWVLLASLPGSICVGLIDSFPQYTQVLSVLGMILSNFCIAFLLPYAATAFMYAYEFLKQDAINKKVLRPEDLGQTEQAEQTHSTTAENQ